MEIKLNIRDKPYLDPENVCYMIDTIMNLLADKTDVDGLFDPMEEEWLGAISLMISTIEQGEN